MNMKKTMLVVMLVSSMTIGLVGCSNNSSSENKSDKENKKDKASSAVTTSNDNKSVADNTNNGDSSKSISKDGSKENTDKDTNKVTATNDSNKSSQGFDDSIKDNITEKVKEYIINGQENKSEAEKINWSKTFLNKVDIEGLYNQYIANGGSDKDLEDFASYMSANAPIPSDWKDLFEKDLLDTYGEKVTRLEPLENDLYKAYVLKDGSEVPYVVVSSRTGYFHG